MAEPKRIQLTSVAPVEKDKKTKPISKTFRINLTLKQSTDTTCPEFSYTDLTRNEGGDTSQDGSSTNPFGDDDDDNSKMAAIARAFEEKYAPKTKGKKGKGVYRDYLEDLVDLGDGYDEDDPFIDNGEAYDEVVPVCMTTSLGGFYINSGMLDFKYHSEDSVDDFRSETPVKKKKKVQQITSDTDSEPGEKKNIIKKRKLKEGIEGGGLKKKKRLMSSDGKKLIKTKLVKKFKKKTSPTVAELLKDQSASTSPVEMKTNGDAPIRLVDGRGDASNLDSMLESSLKGDSSQDAEECEKPLNPEAIPPLPSNIPESLDGRVSDIKKAAVKSSAGKSKFFTTEVNNMLLSIEVSTRQLSCGQRSMIYGHLAAFLPCSKDTLLKRAKKLRLNEVDDKLREPINNLREAVNKVMPQMVEKHEAECRLASIARQEEGKKPTETETKEDASTESDEDEKNNATEGDKTKKRPKGPRKKFDWNSEVRGCLLEVVKAKMLCYDMLKTRTQSPEEYLKAFLDSEIKSIWPQGWMQTRMLYKESKLAHSSWTNPQQKVKKTVMGSKNFTSSPGVNAASVNKSLLGNGDRTPTNSNVIEVTSESSQKSVPTILDYADKVSPTSKLSPNVSPVSQVTLKQSSKPTGYSDVAKPKDSSKHHLVSEILQKPLSIITSTPSASSNPKSPHLTNPNPKDSNFFMEFQKHLSKQLSPSSQEKLGFANQTVSSTTSGPVKTQFKSPTSKFTDSSPKTGVKVSDSIQKQYQTQMTKAYQQAQAQAVAAQQHKRTDQERIAELQFQKAFMASVQSSKTQVSKQFSPKSTTVTAQSQSQKTSPSGRDQILAQIQAELGRGENKLKFKPSESKTTQKIIEDAVMQQMFKQPLPANISSAQQKPLLQQALRSPVSSSGTSPATNQIRQSVNLGQSPVLSHHAQTSRPMTSLISPTSRGMPVDLTADSPPKMRTSPGSFVVKKPSPTGIIRPHQHGSGTSVQRPGYVATSPSTHSKGESVDRAKVFLQPHSTQQQSNIRMTSLLNTSASNKNMQAQWNAAFGVNAAKSGASAFTPPGSVSKTVSSSSANMLSDPSKTFHRSASPVSLTYNDVCEILGQVQSSPVHQGSTTSPATLYSGSHSNLTNQYNHNLLYQQQAGNASSAGANMSPMSPSLQYGHLTYQDTSHKPHGQ